jgi:hypothetical protein
MGQLWASSAHPNKPRGLPQRAASPRGWCWLKRRAGARRRFHKNHSRPGGRSHCPRSRFRGGPIVPPVLTAHWPSPNSIRVGLVVVVAVVVVMVVDATVVPLSQHSEKRAGFAFLRPRPSGPSLAPVPPALYVEACLPFSLAPRGGSGGSPRKGQHDTPTSRGRVAADVDVESCCSGSACVGVSSYLRNTSTSDPAPSSALEYLSQPRTCIGLAATLPAALTARRTYVTKTRDFVTGHATRGDFSCERYQTVPSVSLCLRRSEFKNHLGERS